MNKCRKCGESEGISGTIKIDWPSVKDCQFSSKRIYCEKCWGSLESLIHSRFDMSDLEELLLLLKKWISWHGYLVLFCLEIEVMRYLKTEDKMNKKIKEAYKRLDFGDREVIFLTVYGSHLYGTENENTSDVDFKGVFLPTAEEILLGKIPKSLSFNTKTSEKGDKNTTEDVDCELYSLGYFIDLACQGQTVALDMLFAGPEALIYLSPFGSVNAQSWKFITKNMKAFLGYSRSQARKYSLKGDKLNTYQTLVDFLSDKLTLLQHLQPGDSFNGVKFTGDNLRLGHFFDYPELKELPNVEITKNEFNGLLELDVYGKKVQETVTVQYALDTYQKTIDSYGKRAKEAAENKGLDFKAISHSFRIALELKELYQTGEIKFPLRDAEFIKKIKAGELHFAEELHDKLGELVDEVEELSETCDYPDKVDRKPWNEFLIEEHRKIVLGE